MNLLDRNQNFASRLRRQITFQLVDLGAFTTDDDSGSRGVDDDLQPVCGTLNINVRNSRACETLFQIALELEIFEQKLAELLLCKPVRVPVFVVAQTESVWMNFLTHSFLLFLIFTR